MGSLLSTVLYKVGETIVGWGSAIITCLKDAAMFIYNAFKNCISKLVTLIKETIKKVVESIINGLKSVFVDRCIQQSVENSRSQFETQLLTRIHSTDLETEEAVLGDGETEVRRRRLQRNASTVSKESMDKLSNFVTREADEFQEKIINFVERENLEMELMMFDFSDRQSCPIY